MSKGSSRATAALVFACTFWGLSFVWIKDLDQRVTAVLAPDGGLPPWVAPFWVVTVRFALAGALLALWGRVRRGLRWEVWRDAFWLGLPSAAGYLLQVGGMQGMDAGTNAFLTSLYTPLTPLLAWWLLGARPRGKILVASGLAVLGVALLEAPEEATFGIHEGLVMMGAVCWALQILAIDRFAAGHPTGAFSCALFVWVAALSAPALLWAPVDAERMVRAVVAPELSGPMVGLVLLSTIVSLMLLNRFQPEVDPSRAALIYVAEPAFAAVFAVLLHDEPFGGWKLVGCATLLLANVVSVERATAPTPPPPTGTP